MNSEKIQRLLSDAFLEESNYSVKAGPLTRKGADEVADKLLVQILEVIQCRK